MITHSHLHLRFPADSSAERETITRSPACPIRAIGRTEATTSAFRRCLPVHDASHNPATQCHHRYRTILPGIVNGGRAGVSRISCAGLPDRVSPCPPLGVEQALDNGRFAQAFEQENDSCRGRRVGAGGRKRASGERASRCVSRILFPGALRRPVRRPSISACRRRQAPAAYPQARAGSPRTPAQARTDRALLALLRVGFTEPPRSPGVLVVSYTTVSPLPEPQLRRSAFCGTFPRLTPGCR
jgi:hypothetical protein